MADFRHKATAWPRVSTLAQLLPLLDNVQQRRWRDYSYIANPPCHASDSKESLSVGEAEDGGLRIRCWGECKIDAIEDALGVALQVRYQDGNLRYRERNGGTPPPRRSKPPLSREPIFQVRPFGIADLKGANIWLALKKVKPWTGRLDGITYGYRHSLSNLELARYGGDYISKDKDGVEQRIRLLPHRSYDYVGQVIRRIAEKTKVECRRAISMAASEAVRYPFPLVALDCDYHPDDDRDGSGRAYRDALQRRCVAAGLSVYRSSGGNGFHAVAGVNSASRNYDAYQQEFRQTRWQPPGTQGIAVDVFLPGARHSLTLRLDLPIAEVDGELPLLSLTELNGLMLVGDDDSSPLDVAPDSAEAAKLIAHAGEQGMVAKKTGDGALAQYCLYVLEAADEESPSPAQQERIARGRAMLEVLVSELGAAV